jgi:DNA-directed RNA polymerase specialized sigma24 family protein
MATVLNTTFAIGCNLDDEETFERLIKILRAYTRHWVYSSHLLAWEGCEEDIVDDIVQETLCRCFEYTKRVEYGEALPIYSLKHFAIRIAHNYYVDLLRRDQRLLHIERDTNLHEAEIAIVYEKEDPAEIILERLYESWIFSEVAKGVVRFPKKMRLAVLIELAKRMEAQGEFYCTPSPLRQAFLDEGVHLDEFVGLLPLDPVTRTRHSSLVSLGFKRIAKFVRCRSDLICVDALFQGNEIRKDGQHV